MLVTVSELRKNFKMPGSNSKSIFSMDRWRKGGKESSHANGSANGEYTPVDRSGDDEKGDEYEKHRGKTQEAGLPGVTLPCVRPVATLFGYISALIFFFLLFSQIFEFLMVLLFCRKKIKVRFLWFIVHSIYLYFIV